jgi:hypothetical protein
VLSKSLEWACLHRNPLLGNMEGRSLLRAFGIKGCIKMPGKYVSINIGAPLGKRGGDTLAGTF